MVISSQIIPFPCLPTLMLELVLIWEDPQEKVFIFNNHEEGGGGIVSKNTQNVQLFFVHFDSNHLKNAVHRAYKPLHIFLLYSLLSILIQSICKYG